MTAKEAALPPQAYRIFSPALASLQTENQLIEYLRAINRYMLI